MTIQALNQQFGIGTLLSFAERNSLACAEIRLPAAHATVFLQGAHLTSWQPRGQRDVLFLSERSEFAPGKAIRGGVPICFPWFAARSDGQAGPSHGFARIEEWALSFVALVPGDGGDRLKLTFTLDPTPLSRSLGFDGFRVVYDLFVGASLTLRLTVRNQGPAPLCFEEALHSYFAVGDVRHSTLTGVENASYLDKTAQLAKKQAPPGPLRLQAETDRIFPVHTGPLVIHDDDNDRLIRIHREGSRTAVVWNPWNELAARLPDLGAESWPGFLCVEAANAGPDALTLEPGKIHTLQVDIDLAKP